MGLSVLKSDEKIRIVKAHYANAKLQRSLEFAIPKEMAGKYQLDNESYLMLIPEDDQAMSSIEKTLEKAEIALGVILDHDEKNSDCSFKQVLREIIAKWQELST